MTTETLARSEPQALAYRHELTVDELAAQVDKIHAVMGKIMKDEIHYGTIRGTKKPTLLKPGAELLCMLFRLDPEYAIEELRDGEHLTVRSTVTLYHIPTGLRMGSGMGSCSTREAKYAYRRSGRACPSCGKEDTIIRSKYGAGGWLCYDKKGGCGERFKEGDAAIEEQQTDERAVNPDLADTHNTVLKMSNKRGLVAAVLNVTAASEIFTQDVDRRDEEDETPPARQEPNGTPRAEGDGPAAAEGVISEKQLTRLHAIASASKWSEPQAKALLAEYGFTSSKDVTKAKYEAITERLKTAPPKATAA